VWFGGGGFREEVVLGFDEVEALRLKDLLGFPQEEAAKVMGVSQPTFHRILKGARRKVADALVNHKALRIEGGSYVYDPYAFRPCRWMKGWGGFCEGFALMAEEEFRIKDVKGGGKMKIALTSTGDTLDSLMDERFGRARKIIVYDLDYGSFEVIDNSSNLSAFQGAGIETARKVVEARVKAVISGHFGPNAVRALQAAGVEIYQALGISVGEAIERFKEGKLQRLYGPDKGPHW